MLFRCWDFQDLGAVHKANIFYKSRTTPAISTYIPYHQHSLQVSHTLFHFSFFSYFLLHLLPGLLFLSFSFLLYKQIQISSLIIPSKKHAIH